MPSSSSVSPLAELLSAHYIAEELALIVVFVPPEHSGHAPTRG
jgi:hypothetical protein